MNKEVTITLSRKTADPESIIYLTAELLEGNAGDKCVYTWTIHNEKKEDITSKVPIKRVDPRDPSYRKVWILIPKDHKYFGNHTIALSGEITAKGGGKEVLTSEASLGIVRSLIGVKLSGDDIQTIKEELKKPREVKLLRTETDKKNSKAGKLIADIRKVIEGSTITFVEYMKEIDGLLEGLGGLNIHDSNNYFGMSSYQKLKDETQTFLIKGLSEQDRKLYTYINDLREDLDRNALPNTGIPASRLNILPELIWAYWMEEGYLVQTINAICLRFQNKRLPYGYEALGSIDIDPLRPLNNILWGYIQDEQLARMFPRRVYEYDHQLGLRLKGKAVPTLHSVDSRTSFLGSFNNLLHLCAKYYADTSLTIFIPDGNPILNALKDLHIILAEGAGNQFGDMAWTARQEFLMQQWMLARPEIEEFLRGRRTVLYPEKWMGAVDAMKRIQKWPDFAVRHYYDLAYKGEQIILSIRHYRWDNENNENEARAWVEELRPKIQTYIQSYLAVTGIDLTATVVTSGMERVVPPSYRGRISTIRRGFSNL